MLNVWLLLSPSQLCAEYAMDTIPPISSLSDPRNLLTLTTFAGLLSLGCYAMSGREEEEQQKQQHRRRVAFALCVMVVPFIPASNLFFPVGFVIAERVLYIPSMGFCMLVGYGAWRMLEKTRSKKVYRAATLFFLSYLLVFFSLKTVVRNRDWMDNGTLYRASIKTIPSNPKMLNFVATSVLLPEQNFDLAEKLYYFTIEVEPRYVSVYSNLAEILRRMGKTDESIKASSFCTQYDFQSLFPL